MLAGPRGRRLCAELACAGDPVARSAWFDAAHGLGDGTARRRFVAALGRAAVRLDEDMLLGCLADAVAFAHYWQPPDREDVVLDDPGVVESLRSLADAVVAAPTWRWWRAPMD